MKNVETQPRAFSSLIIWTTAGVTTYWEFIGKFLSGTNKQKNIRQNIAAYWEIHTEKFVKWHNLARHFLIWQEKSGTSQTGKQKKIRQNTAFMELQIKICKSWRFMLTQWQMLIFS